MGNAQLGTGEVPEKAEASGPACGSGTGWLVTGGQREAEAPTWHLWDCPLGPVWTWGPDVDEPHCQPSGALATALPPGQEVASAWDPAHICPCSLRPQHAAS